MSKTTTSVQLEDETIHQLDQQATEEDVTRSQIIRNAIHMYLNKDHADIEELEQRLEEVERVIISLAGENYSRVDTSNLGDSEKNAN